ncbi:MAG: dolichol-phosphate mannosyltransferase [Nanoarchaeota archaeon]|nr:dolichol-phosphate mannosyltransferase [Nanoarchaeota archaeon]|tara:strand:+ start:3882 stop:4586 length:705 start_codon:yes stop_codon:yes gene_type:complete
MNEKTVSVVLPSYNESENIKEAIERIHKALGNQLHEIIVVDDNSPDLTWKIVENLDNPKYRVIRRMTERGLASALARGVHEAKGDIIAWMDCDLGLPPEDLPRLVEQTQWHDIAIGSRYAEGGADNRAMWRGFASYAFNVYTSLLLGFHVRDYTSGFCAVRKEVFQMIPFPANGFGEYFIEFCHQAKKENFRIKEIGYQYNYRKHGTSKLDSSKMQLAKFGFQYAWRVARIRFR